LRSFTGTGGQWAWIKDTGGQSELVLGAASGGPRLRAQGSGWTEVAVDGATLWVLSRTGTGGTLLRLSQEGDTPPEEVLRSDHQLGALLAQGGQVFWLELAVAADPGLAFVPPLGARLRLQCREASGTVRTLLDRPAVDGAAPGVGDLVALTGGQIYLRLRSASGTEFLAVPLQGGSVTRIAGESGTQQAQLDQGALVWTAPSDEAMPESGIRSLRRQAAGGAPETVADWLPGNGDLVTATEGLRYAASGHLYRLPSRLGPPEFLRKIPNERIVSDGQALVVLSGDRPQTLSASGPRP
jgi:hypothetical protein